MRSLAQRSAQAARETAEKIAEAIARTETGAQNSAKVAASFSSIVEKGRQVDDLVASIVAAFEEQSHGIQEITTAVAQVDKVTQTNAASAEETATAAEQLLAKAENNHETTRHLSALVMGAASDRTQLSVESTQDSRLMGTRESNPPSTPIQADFTLRN